MATAIKEELLQFEEKTARAAGLPSVITGVLAGWHKSGDPLVSFRGNDSGKAIRARSTVKVRGTPIGAEVVLVFEQGNWRKPIVLGVMHAPAAGEPGVVGATLDDGRLVLTGDREVVLQCGTASITLTRAGKVILQGTYLLARSTGLNRIQGSAVKIN